MTRLTINIAEDVFRKLESRAKEAGIPNVMDYAATVFWVDANSDEAIDYGAPESVSFRSEADLERILRERMDDNS